MVSKTNDKETVVKTVLETEDLESFKDKLVFVFRNLRTSNNLITRQNFWDSSIHAIEALAVMLSEAEEKGKRRNGAVFYHNQDAANIKFGRVAVRYTDYPNGEQTLEESEAAAADIAKSIVEEIRRQGLFPVWNEDPNSVVWAYYFEDAAVAHIKENMKEAKNGS